MTLLHMFLEKTFKSLTIENGEKKVEILGSHETLCDNLSRKGSFAEILRMRIAPDYPPLYEQVFYYVCTQLNAQLNT